MKYHDDGESELGPAVAALSLGSPSTMRFRPKRNTQFFLPTRLEQGRICYKEVLEVTMKHGDIMVMIGTEIQKVYEVSNPRQKRSMGLSDMISTPSTPTECAASRSPRDTSTLSGWSRRRTGMTPPSRAQSQPTLKPSSMTASEPATTRHRRRGGSQKPRHLCI